MNKILDYKDYIAILISSIPILLSFKNTYSFMTSTTIERQFYSKEKRLFYSLANYFALFVLFSTIIFNYFYKIKILRYLLTVTFLKWNFWIFIISFIFLGAVKFIYYLNKKGKKIKFQYNRIFINTSKVSVVILILTIFSLYGIFNLSILMVKSSLLVKIGLLISWIIIELFAVYWIFKLISNSEFTDPILVNIELDNSQIYREYYIYYPTGKFLLIGKPESINDCKEPILINIDKIVSCKQITEKSSLFLLS